jgi:hypothetical protein
MRKARLPVPLARTARKGQNGEVSWACLFIVPGIGPNERAGLTCHR